MAKHHWNRRTFLQTSALTAAAHRRAGRAARAGRARQGRHPAADLRRHVVFGPAGPHRRDARDRGDQRGRHQVARRREDRAGVRRRAVDAGRRQCRSREDERGGLRGGGRRLRLVDLPCGEPDRGALRPALHRGRRRRRLDRDARTEEHLPLRPRLRRHLQGGDRQPDHAQRRGQQGRQDRDDRARGLGLRLRPRQACSTSSFRKRASR